MRLSSAFTAVLVSAALCAQAAAREWRDRWFYVSAPVGRTGCVEKVRGLCETAKAAGLNGMLLAGGVENADRWDDAAKSRMRQIRQIADDAGIEIIPLVWSVGYGTMLGRDPNLAAALPVKDEPYIVRGGVAAADPAGFANSFGNGGFERFDGRFEKWTVDRYGLTSFRDTGVSAEGGASLRMMAFQPPHGHGRAFQTVDVTPNRNYEFSCMLRTEGLEPVGRFALAAYIGDKCLRQHYMRIPSTQDWTRVAITFNSGETNRLTLYAGVWGGKGGTFWLDDARLEPVAFGEAVRRAGTPLTVRNASTGETMEEGRDFEVVPAGRPDAAVREIRAVEGGRVKEGDRLLVSYYRKAISLGTQVSVCMSEPKLYECFESSARAIMRELAPRKWFLSMDEIRSGGSCESCRARKTDMAHILGDCVTRQHAIIKSVCPDADVYIWSDMFCPDHNARDNYYNCVGTFEGSWNLIPKDIIISCWSNSKIDAMPFFDRLGFRTQAAAYYDSDSLKGCEQWLEVCERTPKCTGIMYTTWRNKYQLMPAFGELIRSE